MNPDNVTSDPDLVDTTGLSPDQLRDIICHAVYVVEDMRLGFTAELAINAWRRLDAALTNGEALPRAWQGERDGYVSGYYRTGAGEYASDNDPNEQE